MRMLDTSQLLKLRQLLISEFASKYRNGVYGYTQRVVTYNSNKIEGSKLSEDQTALLFETHNLYCGGELMFVSKDVEEATGHFIMFNTMLKTLEQDLSVELIKAFHFDLKSGVFEDRANGYAIGDWKKRPNIVGNTVTTNPENVQTEMSKLLENYMHQPVNLQTLAEFHINFEHIHPFQDGNGRVGRILLYRESLKNCMIPIVIYDDVKLNYVTALAKSDTSGLVKLFEDCQQRYWKIVRTLLE